MDPGLYLPYARPTGWPWRVDATPGGALKYHEVATDAHYIAPATICDLLRIKRWLLTFSHSGGAYSGSIDTYSGTAYVDIGSGATVDNTPGWSTQRMAFENRAHSPTGAWSSSVIIRFFHQRIVPIDPNTNHVYTIDLNLFLPIWGWDGTDPIWKIPFQGIGNDIVFASQVEVDLLTSTETLLSSTEGLTYRAATVGSPDPAWILNLQPFAFY